MDYGVQGPDITEETFPAVLSKGVATRSKTSSNIRPTNGG